MSSERPSGEQAPPRLRAISREADRRGADAPATYSRCPQPLTSLIGRDADADAVRALIEAGGARLITLTGPGGVGKTRLALRIGEDAGAAFPDGVVFVPLAAISDPRLVLATVARALGLPEVSALSPLEVVADYVRERRLLLILDNFEQVRPAAGAVASLLAECAELSILVTSRARLNVGGEQRFPVAPLALPVLTKAERDTGGNAPLAAIAASPAVQLFLSRAQAIDPRFALDEANAAAIAAICRRVDGLPLAIELAAARLRHFSPGDLLARLGSALPLLSAGPDDAPDRLRTMRAAIAWSYALLAPAEQSLFRRLAIFSGGFTLDAVEGVTLRSGGDGFALGGEGGKGGSGKDEHATAMAGSEIPIGQPVLFPSPPSPPERSDTPSTLDLVASLVDNSLLQTVAAGGRTRFGMLETIREFGLELLAAQGETEEVAARHAAWCVDLADRSRQEGWLSKRDGLAMLEAEHPNLRAALTWYLERGEMTAALHLAGQLAEFWLRHGHIGEGSAWLERALAAGDQQPNVARVEALVGLGMMLWSDHSIAAVHDLVTEAEQVARAVGDAGALAYARLHQAYLAAFQGDYALAQLRAEESLTAAAAIPQRFSDNGARWVLAVTALALGENDLARERYERLLASAQTEGDDISIANSHFGLAVLAKRRGEPAEALAGLIEAARVCQCFGDQVHGSFSLDHGAAIAFALGAVAPAVRLFATAEAMRAAVGAARGKIAVVDHGFDELMREKARATLGAEGFAAAWAEGSARSLDEAIAELITLASQIAAPDRVRRVPAGAPTWREREVLRLLVDGLTDKEIATALSISSRTVSKHVAALREKLGAPSRTAAAAIAIRDGLIARDG